MQERFKTFTVQIATVSRCIRRIKTEEVAEFELKSPHVSCIYYLYKAGSLTATELCEACEEDKANVSRSVEHLEANGYLCRDPKDKRKYKSPLVLTQKGMEVGEILASKIDSILDLAGQGLTDEERAIFYKSLMIISENLQKICDGYDRKD